MWKAEKGGVVRWEGSASQRDQGLPAAPLACLGRSQPPWNLLPQCPPLAQGTIRTGRRLMETDQGPVFSA